MNYSEISSNKSFQSTQKNIADSGKKATSQKSTNGIKFVTGFAFLSLIAIYSLLGLPEKPAADSHVITQSVACKNDMNRTAYALACIPN